jgi:galactokinase
MTVGALPPQGSVFQPSAVELIGKFLLYVRGKGLPCAVITSLNPG